MSSKINLAKEAAAANPDEFDGEVTEAMLKELCPPAFAAAFKASKSMGQRVDFLHAANEHRKEITREAEEMKKFQAMLERWFIQELPTDDATGVAGKVARLQLRDKEKPSVKDWDKFYAYIKKNNAFELLNRAPNAKSIAERWEAKKEVPGVEKYRFRAVSLTKVK